MPPAWQADVLTSILYLHFCGFRLPQTTHPQDWPEAPADRHLTGYWDNLFSTLTLQERDSNPRYKAYEAWLEPSPVHPANRSGRTRTCDVSDVTDLQSAPIAAMVTLRDQSDNNSHLPLSSSPSYFLMSVTGLEPATFGLRVRCYTIKPHRRIVRLRRFELPISELKVRCLTAWPQTHIISCPAFVSVFVS